MTNDLNKPGFCHCEPPQQSRGRGSLIVEVADCYTTVKMQLALTKKRLLQLKKHQLRNDINKGDCCDAEKKRLAMTKNEGIASAEKTSASQ